MNDPYPDNKDKQMSKLYPNNENSLEIPGSRKGGGGGGELEACQFMPCGQWLGASGRFCCITGSFSLYTETYLSFVIFPLTFTP